MTMHELTNYILVQLDQLAHREGLGVAGCLLIGNIYNALDSLNAQLPEEKEVNVNGDDQSAEG